MSDQEGIIQEIAGTTIEQLAEDYGTPLYVYDIAPIAERISQLKDFGVIRYALKACSNISILSYMRELGVLVDCVSVGELKRAMKAGYQADSSSAPSPEIVYTCDIFDEESLEFVISNNIAVNVGSIDMIDQLGEASSGYDITIRINPGFGHGHSQKTNTGGESSKHGIWIGDLEKCLETAKRNNCVVTGLHMHIGSGTDLAHLGEVCSTFKECALKIGSSLKMISAGGGLPIPYRESDQEIDLDGYKNLWWDVKSELESEFGHELRLETEPGRYLTAEAGYLISEVRAIKSQGSQNYVLVDAGFTDLARPIMYGSYHPIRVCPKEITGNTIEAAIAGPLCESGDVFTQKEGGFVESRTIAEVKVGDYLVLENAGSYGVVMASNYNSRPLCPEVLLKDGNAKLIRRRQSVEEMLSLEVV
jgi:diaminopimelate decarboxylase